MVKKSIFKLELKKCADQLRSTHFLGCVTFKYEVLGEIYLLSYSTPLLPLRIKLSEVALKLATMIPLPKNNCTV